MQTNLFATKAMNTSTLFIDGETFEKSANEMQRNDHVCVGKVKSDISLKLYQNLCGAFVEPRFKVCVKSQLENTSASSFLFVLFGFSAHISIEYACVMLLHCPCKISDSCNYTTKDK